MILRLWMKGSKNPAYRKRIRERFGVIPHKPQPGGLWVHSVSVGETIASAPLVKAFMTKHPNTPVIVTTTTPTGSEQVKRLFGERVFHMYLPFDLPSFLQRLIHSLQPGLLVIMETELWPNLLATCEKNKVPVMLANARLSEKSAQGYAKFSGLTRPMLKQLSYVAAQNQADGQRLIELGLTTNRLEITGSLKFDVAVPDNCQQTGTKLREEWGKRRSVLALASSHPDEDELILDLYPRLVAQCPDLLLMLIPRHPERFEEVVNAAHHRQLNVHRRSSGSATKNTQVYVADSMGEMFVLLAAADVVLMGGSLVEHGGHNPIEPAALGKATLTGANYRNFAAIVDDLAAQEAIEILASNNKLEDRLVHYLTTPQAANHMGTNAKQVVDSNRGVADKLLDRIDQLLLKTH